MISVLRLLRKPRQIAGLIAITAILASCQATTPGTGARISGQTVQVAMLLPMTSAQGGDAVIARSLENAARMAAAEGRSEAATWAARARTCCSC